MNAHLSKPVTSAKLIAVLGQWLPDVALRKQESQICENELSAALAQIPGLEIGQSWRRSVGKLNDYVTLLDRFVEQHGRDMALLRRHLAAGEDAAAHKLAHNLKGISGLIGARQIERLSTELLQALRSGASHANIAALESACENELQQLAAAVRTLSAPPRGAADT